MIDRRLFLTGTLGLGAGLVLPRTRLWAGTRITAGDLQIDTLSDGNLMLPFAFSFGGLPQDELAPIVARHSLPTDMLEPPCNLTLVRDGTNTVLFDVGSGPDFMPSAGKITEALAALDLAPDDITHVVFTHGHPDHLWGLLDEFDDPVFANASFLMGRAEFDYWADPETVNTIDAERQSFAVGAARRLDVIGEMIERFEDGDTVLPGIRARMTPGHTPGHMSFQIADQVLVVGDAIGNHHVAFDRPDWPASSDQDPALAATTRIALLNELAESGLPMIGFHLPGGGLGRVLREGNALRFEASA